MVGGRLRHVDGAASGGGRRDDAGYRTEKRPCHVKVSSHGEKLLAPPFSASLRVQLLAAVPGHAHPVPAIDTSVRPDGTDSATVTVPLVGPAPLPFDTVT